MCCAAVTPPDCLRQSDPHAAGEGGQMDRPAHKWGRKSRTSLRRFGGNSTGAMVTAGYAGKTEKRMIIRTQEDVTGAVLSEIARAGDPRFREIMSSLVRHLHAFAREVKLTETEFQAAATYTAPIAHNSPNTHNPPIPLSR